jgi:hypothetical protein
VGRFFRFEPRAVDGRRSAAFQLRDLTAHDAVAAAALRYRAAHFFGLLPDHVVSPTDAPAAQKKSRQALKHLLRRRPRVVLSASVTRFHRQAVLGSRVIDSNFAFFTVDAAMPVASDEDNEPASGSGTDELSDNDETDDDDDDDDDATAVGARRKQVV